MTPAVSGSTSEQLARDARALVDVCAWPSEAFWRVYELHVLREVAFEKPIFELGCGDGSFTELLGLEVEDAIDLNPRAAARAAARSIYGRVRCADIRALDVDLEQRYRTVFANSVLEHIEGASNVLSVARRLLEPGGRLVTTVPLVDMNRHLLAGVPYARFRQRQLQHRNLWTRDQWEAALLAAGFTEIEWKTYLPGTAIRSWDPVDLLGALGAGRYRVATAARKLAAHILPAVGSDRLKAQIARRVATRVGPLSAADDCAGLVVARV